MKLTRKRPWFKRQPNIAARRLTQSRIRGDNPPDDWESWERDYEEEDRKRVSAPEYREPWLIIILLLIGLVAFVVANSDVVIDWILTLSGT